MTEEQIDVNGDIQALRCALEGIIAYSGRLSHEDKKELGRLHIRFGDYIIKEKT